MQCGLALQIVMLLHLLLISDHFTLVVLVVHVRSGAHTKAILGGRCLIHWLHIDGLCLRIGLLHILELLWRHGTDDMGVHEAVDAGMCALEGFEGDCALLVGESVAHDQFECALCLECVLRQLCVETLGFFEIRGLTAVLASAV